MSLCMHSFRHRWKPWWWHVFLQPTVEELKAWTDGMEHWTVWLPWKWSPLSSCPPPSSSISLCSDMNHIPECMDREKKKSGTHIVYLFIFLDKQHQNKCTYSVHIQYLYSGNLYEKALHAWQCHCYQWLQDKILYRCTLFKQWRYVGVEFF